MALWTCDAASSTLTCEAAATWATADGWLHETVQPSGGWYHYVRYEQAALRERARRLKAKRDKEEADEIQDEIDRKIAVLLHEQEERDAANAEKARLLALAARYSHADDVPERVAMAAVQAKLKATQASIEALGREIERARDDEDIAALMVLLNQ